MQMLPSIKMQINRSIDLILFGIFTVIVLSAVLWANGIEVRSASPNDSTLPIDDAKLDSQGDYVSARPGDKVRIWINVRNIGTTTWSSNTGYKWRGLGQWAGRSNSLNRDTAPSQVYPFAEDIIAPGEFGEYTYGFVLQHSGQDFGPSFFIKVRVNSFIKTPIHAAMPWSFDCTQVAAACLPAKLTVTDLAPEWQPHALAAAAMWSNLGTGFRFVSTHINEQQRVIQPLWNGEPITGIKLAIGEVRIIPASKLPSDVAITGFAGVGLPFEDRDHSPGQVVAGLVILQDDPLQMWPLYWGFDGNPTLEDLIKVPSKIDLRTLIAHELGHVLGICGHDKKTDCSENAGAVSESALMHSYENELAKLTFYKGLPRTKIHDDDIQLVTSLYGPNTSSQTKSLDRPELTSPSRLVPLNKQGSTYSFARSIVDGSIYEFRWQGSLEAKNYVFQLSDSPTFQDVLYSSSISETVLQVPLVVTANAQETLVLQPNQEYFWRVQSSKGSFNSDWSFPWKIRTETQGCSSSIDANCDGQVSLADYETWRQEYTGEASTAVADFSGNGVTDLLDYVLWQQAYFDPANTTFSPEPESVTQPANVSFERSAMAVSDDQDIKVNIIFETDKDARVSMGAIAVKYPSQFLSFVRVDPCNAGEAAIAGEHIDTEKVQSAAQQLDGETINVIHTPSKINDLYPSGRFCFGALVFSQKAEFGVSNITELTLDNTFTRWEAVGPQVNFYTRLDGEKNMLRLFKGAGAVPDKPTLSSPATGERFVEGAAITVEWLQAANANLYAAEYGYTNSGDFYYSGKQETQTLPLRPLSVGEYWWHVEAYSDNGWWSGWSDRRTFTIIPQAPTNLRATNVSCQQVELAWENHSPSTTSYQIARVGDDQLQNYTVEGADLVQYVDLTVKEGKIYSYIVQAESSGIGSDASNIVEISVPSCTPAAKFIFLPFVQR